MKKSSDSFEAFFPNLLPCDNRNVINPRLMMMNHCFMVCSMIVHTGIYVIVSSYCCISIH